MSSKSEEAQSDLSVIIEKLLCNGVKRIEVEDKYILPLSQRPQLSEVSYSESIPVVDLQDLDGPNRAEVVHEIQHACEEDGFFQVHHIPQFQLISNLQIVNHGVPETVMKRMMEIAKEFFEMPVEDRACLYSEDPKQRVRLSKSFTNKEKVLNWRESLSHPINPLSEVKTSWPEKPAAYREIAAKYAMNVKALALRLLAAISEALGLDSDYLNTNFGNHGQSMVINYYPPCPNPDLTMGLPGHSDGSGITVLMQGDVDGLQILKNGKWVAVKPIANAFVINLGDLLQVVSNGRFRSVQHRAITNVSTARISVATFCSPSVDVLIAPAASLVDEQHPALYTGFKVQEFVRVGYSDELKGKKLLDYFKIQYPEDNGE
eukprot:PITA_25153